MIYTANITTDAKEDSAELKKTTINVTKGLVYKVEFYFPPGSAGLMGVAVFDGLFQVWPSNVGEFFTGDDVVISFDDMYLKNAAPFQFQCYTYNEDDTNDHVVGVRIGLVSKDVFLARFLPGRAVEDFTKLLAQMEAEREERARRQAERRRETPFSWMVRQEAEL